jgi:CheY-like chemotaxis protein
MSLQETKSNILYADDDTDDLEMLAEAFSCHSQKINFITCRNGAEALAYLKKLSPLEASPCLIILDINMPIIGGKEALVKLRSMDRFKETPVVLFTTSSQATDEAFARQYKAGFMTKPIDVGHLEKIADAFIEHCSDDIKKSLRRSVQ